ncbi:MAG: hypothetical protein ACRDBG_28780, partial [Waterburya sp.]
MNCIEQQIKETIKKLNIPFFDPCDPSYKGDCEICPPVGGGGGGLTTHSLVYNPATDVLTSVVNGVSASTIISFDSNNITINGPITIGGNTYNTGTELTTIINDIVNNLFDCNKLASCSDEIKNIINKNYLETVLNNSFSFATYNSLTNKFDFNTSVAISTDPNNSIVLGSDGKLYSPKFTFKVNAGLTSASSDNSLGEQIINNGETVHFFSSTGEIGLNVTPGSAVVNVKLDQQGAVTGQLLRWDGAKWSPATISGGGSVSSVGVTDTPDLDLSVINPTTIPNIAGVLTPTGVTSGTYGNGSTVSSFTVDSKGRVSFAGNVPISIPIDQLSDVDTSTIPPVLNQILRWNGTSWQPSNESIGSVISVNGSSGSDINVTTTDPTTTAVVNAVLNDTAITPGNYGSSSTIPTFNVSQKGRLNS